MTLAIEILKQRVEQFKSMLDNYEADGLHQDAQYCQEEIEKLEDEIKSLQWYEAQLRAKDEELKKKEDDLAMANNIIEKTIKEVEYYGWMTYQDKQTCIDILYDIKEKICLKN